MHLTLLTIKLHVCLLFHLLHFIQLNRDYKFLHTTRLHCKTIQFNHSHLFAVQVKGLCVCDYLQLVELLHLK